MEIKSGEVKQNCKRKSNDEGVVGNHFSQSIIVGNAREADQSGGGARVWPGQQLDIKSWRRKKTRWIKNRILTACQKNVTKKIEMDKKQMKKMEKGKNMQKKKEKTKKADGKKTEETPSKKSARKKGENGEKTDGRKKEKKAKKGWTEKKK